jgi:hypothetical protein
MPAKNRGLYFDGSSDGYLTIPSVLLYHTFSIHAWVMTKADPGAEQTIFSKSRPAALDKPLVRCGIDADYKVVASIGQDVDAANVVEQVGGTALDKSTWYYVVCSFALTGGKETTYKIFLNNAEDASAAKPMFLVDDAAYTNYVGL